MSAAVRPAGPEDADALARLRHAFRTELNPPAESEEAFLGRCTRWMAERLADSSRRLYERFGFRASDRICELPLDRGGDGAA